MRRLLLALLLTTAPAGAAEPPAPVPPFVGIKPAEVTIALTRRIDFKSRVNGQRYSLSIALPVVPPPPGGYPVIYVLDGVAYFGAATEAARGNQLPIVVVGIGYPFDDPEFVAAEIGKPRPPNGEASLADVAMAIQTTRTLDLTQPTPPAEMEKLKIPGMGPMKVGGVDALLKVIETEIKPQVAAILPVNAGNQALYGHSLGGLAVLRALFTEPQAFRSFIAASPSIWWSSRSVLADEAAFAAKVSSGAVAPRVLITVGALEQTSEPVPPGIKMTQAEVDKLTLAARMVDNAGDLAARLKALKGGPGYSVANTVFADENHGSVELASVARGVIFAAKGKP